jgi:sugar phosphate isomerase/epimerase
VWAGLSGPAVWNFTQGPATIGLVPDEHRRTRIAELKRAADFAALLEAPAIVTHLGFIPEDPNDGLYAALEDAVAEVAAHCESQGVAFWFETGQETPVTLLRLIEDLESDHVGINLDTANCVLYGKANPVDSLDVFGRYVRSLHAKDGFYPANGRELGREVALGQGKVDWPALWRGLKALGFEGDIIIEREIGGPEQVSDIRAAAAFLQSLTAT